MKKYISSDKVGEYLESEEMIVSSFTINKDKSITAEVQLGIYMLNGERYFTYHKVRFKKDK